MLTFFVLIGRGSIPGCWVHVSSILKTISTCRVPKQSEKTLVVLAPGCQVN